MPTPRKVLPLLVLAQFLCTSVWFAGNAGLAGLTDALNLPANALGSLVAAIQTGFIAGTLTFAVLALADRFSPVKVFMVSALAAALANAAAVVPGNNLLTLLTGRFTVGFFLAGIYPVGMKIAADHFAAGLGKSLGFLVGALVLGTALPHGILALGAAPDWRMLLLTTSALAVAGGVAVGLLVPDGPDRKASQQPELTAFMHVFRDRELRSAAFGYFGHMWELYAFWAFVPLLVGLVVAPQDVSRWSFVIIAVGGVGCVAAGFLAERWGAKRTAATALAISGICCLASPLLLTAGASLALPLLLIWGFTVVADSPLFSTLVAQAAPAAQKATALTLVNCLGYALTVVSIILLSNLQESFGVAYLPLLLFMGPVLGLSGLRKRRTGS